MYVVELICGRLDRIFYCERSPDHFCTEMGSATMFDKVGADSVSVEGLPYGEFASWARRIVKVT